MDAVEDLDTLVKRLSKECSQFYSIYCSHRVRSKSIARALTGELAIIVEVASRLGKRTTLGIPQAPPYDRLVASELEHAYLRRADGKRCHHAELMVRLST